MTAIDQKQINKQQTNRYEKYYRQIGLNIAYYRKLRGMSQMALAEATDLSRTHISNIEAPNMKTSLSLESLFDIAGVLQVFCRLHRAPCSISVMRNRRIFMNKS